MKAEQEAKKSKKKHQKAQESAVKNDVISQSQNLLNFLTKNNVS